MTCPTIYKGRDNTVELIFSFDDDFAVDGLNNFSKIEVEVGYTEEAHNTTDNPSAVYVIDENTLAVAIGGTTSLPKGSYYISVIGYSGAYPNGYVLVAKGKVGCEYIERLVLEDV